MRNRKLLIFSLGCLGIFIYSSFFIFYQNVLADDSIIMTVRISVCGDGQVDNNEQCDGANLNSQTCATRGFTSGTLTCNIDCTFNTSQCSVVVPPSGGGGGGGGGGEPTITEISFVGRAYPLSRVTVLKDGQIAVTSIAGPDSKFRISLSGLSAGNYNFAVYSEDDDGRRSSLFTFPVYLTKGSKTEVSGIFITPTIAVDKSQVKLGDNIAIFGQSVPSAKVTISIGSAQEFFRYTDTDKTGVYLYNLDTSILDKGEHSAKSKAEYSQEISSFGKSIAFLVGDSNIDITQDDGSKKADVNNDDRVNLVDFSVLAYWYKKASPPDKVDLNSDGKVDLIDFSIMAFYWTG